MKRILGLWLVLVLAGGAVLAEDAVQQDWSALAEGCRVVGSYVTFGTYPQTAEGDDATPIEWLVLACDETGSRAMLLSRYGLDALPYHTEREAVVWETCSLRTWLNHDFLQTAFTEEEQRLILTTKVDNGQEQGYRPYAPKNLGITRDKLFLLSYAEAKHAFGGLWEDTVYPTRARTAPTPYAAGKGVIVSTYYRLEDGQGTAPWWLRSEGNSTTAAAAVDSVGRITNYSVSNKTNPKMVRPALWLDLNALGR